MVRIARIAGICALALSTSALAEQTATQQPSQQPPIKVTGEKPQKPEKLVCREENTGSLITTRVCRTQEQWKQAQQDSQDTLNAMRDYQRARCGNGLMC